jgi:glycosyltransferase involved in cell wall biosynthesis
MLKDRFTTENFGVDVIIPVYNTNKYWRDNLVNIYSRIPVARLLISDGGCTDDSLDILADFPRVFVYDHSHIKSLGGCLKELILNVKTDYFIYLHSDVQLPENWFDTMFSKIEVYDWFECHRKFIIDYEFFTEQYKQTRAFSGSQFGKSELLKKAVEQIDDDYLYRNEDLVIHDLVLKAGGKYGKVMETYHDHQFTNKKGELEPKIKSLDIKKIANPEFEKKMWNMQWSGLVKYGLPSSSNLDNISLSILRSRQLNNFTWNALRKLVYLNQAHSFKRILFHYYRWRVLRFVKELVVLVADNSRLFQKYRR